MTYELHLVKGISNCFHNTADVAPTTYFDRNSAHSSTSSRALSDSCCTPTLRNCQIPDDQNLLDTSYNVFARASVLMLNISPLWTGISPTRLLLLNDRAPRPL
jgi:hypothetical protein